MKDEAEVLTGREAAQRCEWWWAVMVQMLGDRLRKETRIQLEATKAALDGDDPEDYAHRLALRITTWRGK